MALGVLLQVLAFFFWALLWLGGAATVSPGGGKPAAVVVEGRFPIAATDDDFVCATMDWWPPEKCDYGTCSWGLDSLLNLNLSNPILLNAVKAFSPLKIRLGGTLQDVVTYDVGAAPRACTPFVKNTSAMFGFNPGCLPMHRWDELNGFFRKSGAKVIFGLNALNGRVPLPDGSVGGPWNYTNAASLIRYTADRGYEIHGWELGNELSGSGVGVRISADQYAADVSTLKSIINGIYQGKASRPLVVAPGGLFDASWYTEFITKTKPTGSLDVITHHIYNLGPGVDTHLIEKILNPTYLDGVGSIFSTLQAELKAAGTSTVAWVGEAGGAYNSGHPLITDAFVFSFWYLDQLGMSAKYDTKTYCRQTLIGGNYGLLNTTTFEPNPDYYSALLWHRLMGTRVLETTFAETNMIRTYAHCARDSRGITLLLINLSGNTTSQVHVSPASAQVLGLKTHSRRSSRLPGLGEAVGPTREEYHLTPKGGDIQSQTMLLNGHALATDADGRIPKLKPVRVAAATPITVAPFSIVFAQIPSFLAPACR